MVLLKNWLTQLAIMSFIDNLYTSVSTKCIGGSILYKPKQSIERDWSSNIAK